MMKTKKNLENVTLSMWLLRIEQRRTEMMAVDDPTKLFEEAAEVLDKFDGNIEQASKAVLRRAASPLATYLVMHGLRHIKARHRNEERKRLAAKVPKQECVAKPETEKAKHWNPELTQKAVKRIQENYDAFLTNWKKACEEVREEDERKKR